MLKLGKPLLMLPNYYTVCGDLLLTVISSKRMQIKKYGQYFSLTNLKLS